MQVLGANRMGDFYTNTDQYKISKNEIKKQNNNNDDNDDNNDDDGDDNNEANNSEKRRDRMMFYVIGSATFIASVFLIRRANKDWKILSKPLNQEKINSLAESLSQKGITNANFEAFRSDLRKKLSDLEIKSLKNQIETLNAERQIEIEGLEAQITEKEESLNKNSDQTKKARLEAEKVKLTNRLTQLNEIKARSEVDSDMIKGEIETRTAAFQKTSSKYTSITRGLAGIAGIAGSILSVMEAEGLLLTESEQNKKTKEIDEKIDIQIQTKIVPLQEKLDACREEFSRIESKNK